MKKMKRLLAGFLVCTMIIGLFAFLSFADDDTDEMELSLLGLMEYIVENEDGEFTSAQVSDAKKAVAWLEGTSSKASWYDGYVTLGEEATSWENLLEALTYMDAVNGIREENNQSELGISLQSMAGAALNCFYSGNVTFNHSGSYFISCENLSRGNGEYTGGDTVDSLASPFTAWYTKEKAVYDAAAEEDEYLEEIRYQAYSVYSYNSSLYSSTGHYLNLIWSSIKSFGIATGSGVIIYSGSTSTASFTVEEFKELVAAYENLANCANGNHTWDNGTVTKEATCEEEGEITYTCSVCGNTYTETTETTDHAYDTGEVTKEATCTEDGEVTYTCMVCGETYTEVIAAAGHSYEITSEAEATCTEDGYTTYTCSVCGDTYTETTDAIGHSFTDYVYNDDATCTEDGTMTAECDNGCGETDTVTAEGTATGHDYDYDNMEWYWADDYSSAAVIVRCKNDSTHTQLIEATVTSRISDSGVSTIYTAVVEINGETYESGYNVPFSSGYADEECDDDDHVWDEGVEIKEATCTEDGLIEYTCQICGKTVTEIISAGHFYVVSASKEPTCTEEGEYVYECQVCGYTYTEVAEMLLHTYDYDNGVVTKEATCEEEGEITYTCQVCGNTETDTIAATGHNYDYDNVSWVWSEDYTSASLTVTCTNNPEHTESYEAWVTRSVVTDATCTESGTVEYTATITLADITYEDTQTVEIEAFGHDEGDPVIENYVQGDCTQNGSYDTVIYCTECEEELSRETTIVETEREGGHNYCYIFDEEDATCTEDGYIIYMCDGCDSTYTETIEATGHDYIVLLSEEATCTEEGYTVYICSVCGDTYTETTDAIGHSFTEYVYNDDAACTEDGTMTAVCDNGCGETDTVTAEGTATGHDFDYDNIEWNWSEDYSSAAAIVRCSNNSLHTELIVAEVTTEAGDSENVYTATITVDGVAYTDTVTVQNANTDGEDPEDSDSGSENDTTTDGEDTQPEDDTTTDGEDTQPEDDTTTDSEDTQPEDNTTNDGEDTQPEDDTTTDSEDSQPEDDTTTDGEDLQPEDNTTSDGEDSQPEDDTTTDGEDTQPEDDTTNGGDDTLTDDDTTNGGDDTLTGDDTANGGDDTLTGDDTTAGGNDTTTDSGDNTITGDTSDDDDNTLTDDETTVSSSTDTESADDDETSPATGDENHTMLWIVLSILCVIMLAGAVTAIIAKNRKLNN